MEITGKVIYVSTAEQRYYAQDNTWAKDYFVIETEEQYPKRAMMEVISSAEKPRWKNMDVKVGEIVKAHFDVEARMNKEQTRWFNSINCWKVERPGQTQPIQMAAPQPKVTPQQIIANSTAPQSQGDLPF